MKNKSHSNTMMQFGEKVVWMVHNDNNLWNKLELLHQYGVLGRSVPRTREIVVLTPEGAELVLTETLWRQEMRRGFCAQDERSTAGFQDECRWEYWGMHDSREDRWSIIGRANGTAGEDEDETNVHPRANFSWHLVGIGSVQRSSLNAFAASLFWILPALWRHNPLGVIGVSWRCPSSADAHGRALSDGGGFDGFFRFSSRITVQVFLTTPATGAHRAHAHEVSVAAAAQESPKALSGFQAWRLPSTRPWRSAWSSERLGCQKQPDCSPPVRARLSRTAAFLILHTPTPLGLLPDLPRGLGHNVCAPIATFLPRPQALVRQSCAPLFALFPDTSFGTGWAVHSSDSPAPHVATLMQPVAMSAEARAQPTATPALTVELLSTPTAELVALELLASPDAVQEAKHLSSSSSAVRLYWGSLRATSTPTCMGTSTWRASLTFTWRAALLSVPLLRFFFHVPVYKLLFQLACGIGVWRLSQFLRPKKGRTIENKKGSVTKKEQKHMPRETFGTEVLCLTKGCGAWQKEKCWKKEKRNLRRRETRSGNFKPCMKSASSAVLGRTIKRKSPKLASLWLKLDYSLSKRARAQPCKSEATQKKASRWWAESVATTVQEMTPEEFSVSEEEHARTRWTRRKRKASSEATPPPSSVECLVKRVQ